MYIVEKMEGLEDAPVQIGVGKTIEEVIEIFKKFCDDNKMMMFMEIDDKDDGVDAACFGDDPDRCIILSTRKESVH